MDMMLNGHEVKLLSKYLLLLLQISACFQLLSEKLFYLKKKLFSILHANHSSPSLPFSCPPHLTQSIPQGG